MSKPKQQFVCNQCGANFNKWLGQCTECHEWNSVVEFRPARAASGTRAPSGARSGYAGQAGAAEVQTLSEVELAELPRVASGFIEVDRVLGGGFVPGSAILIGGDPGAGKSTLMLQIMERLAQANNVLYVTGEESTQQIAMRAKRLGYADARVKVLAETSLDTIIATLDRDKPSIALIDSIQVIFRDDITSAPGSVSQVRECASELVRYAKQTNTIVVLIGHVTKEGNLAGPRVLEHMIDCSLMLDSSADSRYRMIRSHKNRFGAVNELGVFAMTDQGLKEIANPSAIFLSRDGDPAPGSVVTALWEGTRPMLVEIQALVDESHLGNPRRVVVGLDNNRLAMLLAVLHRHAGISASDQDVFANVVGGVRITETGADLPLLLSILSSLRERPLPRELLCFGEIGLSGELRPVSNGQERLREAAKQGFTKAIVPYANRPKAPIDGLEVIAVRKIDQVLEHI